MRKLVILFVLLSFLLVGTGLAIAQDGGGEDPNLCLSGEWYCPDPDDPDRQDWNWSCGWYWGQFYTGEIHYNQVPSWCKYTLTATPPPTTLGEICGAATVVTLWAGQHINAGTVTVANNATHLEVVFNTSGDWLIAEAHVAVATSLAGIPQTASGNPKPGQFPYAVTLNPPRPAYGFIIPLDPGWTDGTTLYVAAHASLVLLNQGGSVVQQETAWGDGPDFPGSNWATYIVYTVQPCESPETGCTLTQGYWSTHSSYGPAPYDDNWATVGEDTPFFTSGQTWYSALHVPIHGDAYYILAQQYIAAVLNTNNGASTTPEVDAALTGALNWFNTHAPGMPSSTPDGQTAVGYSVTLDQYNNGFIGPGHCE